MTIIDWFQILILIILTILSAPILGRYIALVFQGKPHYLTFFSSFENQIYRLCSISTDEQMDYKNYLKAILLFNFLGFIFLFFILLIQFYLPLNPQKFSGLSWDLAFNTAISFVTNTNWQAYAGETTLSYFSQMVGLTTQNFLSAATGIAVMMALIRGFTNRSTTNLGNFWVDVMRSVIYLLLPLSFILSVILVSQGVIQSLSSYPIAETLDGLQQTIPLGPVASQIAIKQIGSNGGGFFGVNSAHPFENPNIISNFFEHFAILLIPSSLIFTFGYLIEDIKQSRVLFYLITFFWVLGIILAVFFSNQNNPSLELSNNLEGIETRFAISQSAFWTISTTAVANGSSNASISSLEPIPTGIALFNMMIGELIYGGVGVGFCTLFKFILLSIFLAGLLVGRTPEYLGKKIEKREILWIIIALLTPCALILLGTSLSLHIPFSTSSISHKGPHGFTEVLYAFSSTVGNNGSAFAGLNANTPYYNIILGIAMLLGRLSIVVPSLMIAGLVSTKKYCMLSEGTLETNNFLFSILLGCTIFIIGALTFFPALILGPIFEHLLMINGEVF
jgi:K+-transporting ATPase ATPase A chain